MNDSTLPGCVGFYGKPIRPNSCNNCNFRNICRNVVHKKRLEPIHARIQDIELTLRGEKV